MTLQTAIHLFTPPSPAHGTPFTETTLSTQVSPTATGLHFDVESMVLATGTFKKPFPKRMLYLISASSRILFLKFPLPASHIGPSHDSSSASRSRKRSRPPIASVQLSSPTLGSLSYALELTLRMRVLSLPRSRGADLEMDVDVMRSDGIEIDPEIQAEIDERCQERVRRVWRSQFRSKVEGLLILYARGYPEPAQEGCIGVGEDNRGIEAPVSVKSQMSRPAGPARRSAGRMGKERAHGERDDSDIVQFMARQGCGAYREQYIHLTREAVNDQSDRRVAEALRVRDAVKNLGPLMGDEVEQEEVGGNGNGGNGDGGK
ncbi:hypothetical protein Tco_0665233 [Tanacetum coccineum]